MKKIKVNDAVVIKEKGSVPLREQGRTGLVKAKMKFGHRYEYIVQFYTPYVNWSFFDRGELKLIEEEK